MSSYNAELEVALIFVTKVHFMIKKRKTILNSKIFFKFLQVLPSLVKESWCKFVSSCCAELGVEMIFVAKVHFMIEKRKRILDSS